MKIINRLSCLFFIFLSTACGQQNEIMSVTNHTQTSETSIQPIPTKTPTQIPTPIPSVNERYSAHGFPKLYNQYQAGWPSDTQLTDMERLKLWDIITVDAESLNTIEYLLGPNGLLRSNNPYLIISVYFSAGNSEPTSEGDGGFFARFNDGLESNWLIRDINGTFVKGFKFESGWSAYYNFTVPGITEYFANFLQHELIDTGLFDGIFYDWGAVSIFSWLNFQNTELHDGDLIDLDQDGVPETNEQIDTELVSAMRDLHITSRDHWGDEILILGNGGPGSTPDYVSTLNGNMTECFQSNLDAGVWEELRNSWSSHMMTYASYALQAQEPRIAINLVCGRNNPDNFELVRYTLASTLLFDGYYGYAGNDGPWGGDYNSTWWYDEYSVNTQTGEAVEALEYKGYLGNAYGPAYNVVDSLELLVDSLGIGSDPVNFTNKMAEMKVWRRDFENGIVLVNPTEFSVTIDLRGTFKKILGSRDPTFNDGSVLDTIILPATSGVVLLRQ